MKPFSILHISDLHRAPSDPISNDELISALLTDRERYTAEDPPISAPEAILVSGDIVQGVPLNTKDSAAELGRQYAVAEAFLDELVRRFLAGDRSRLIMVPGNHDVDWNTAFRALEPVERAAHPRNLATVLNAEESEYRWDWKSLTLYRIADPALYARRLEAFWTFFRRFYAGTPGLLKVDAGSDANLFTLCDNRIAVAAFNSCYGNDCFAFHGMIRRDVIARSHLELNDTEIPFDLRIAVWHHSIEGPPYRTDYMDIDVVRGMIGRDFRLGLYGHQHKVQITPYHVWLPDRERIAAVSAGSLCAAALELPTGAYRQYNVLEIAPDFHSVRVHVRAMTVANLFSRGYLPEFGGASFAELDWNAPRSIAGTPVNINAARIRQAIERAEMAAKQGRPDEVVRLLRLLPLPSGSYQRDLILSAAMATESWTLVVEVTAPPTTIGELVQRVEAQSRLNRTSQAETDLEQFSGILHLPSSIAAELEARINAQKAIAK